MHCPALLARAVRNPGLPGCLGCAAAAVPLASPWPGACHRAPDPAGCAARGCRAAWAVLVLRVLLARAVLLPAVLVLPPLGRWALEPGIAFCKWWQELQPMAIFAVFQQEKSGDRKI